MPSTDFQDIFAQHVDFVWRVLRRHGVPERELEDYCQEVFVVVHQKRATFEGRSSLRTWIYAIAVRVALGARRKSHVRREVLEATPPEEAAAESALERAATNQTLARAAQALSAMAPEKREVFVLYELEGLTMAEVAASLEIPEPTALSRLYTARQEIQRHVNRQEAKNMRRAYAERSTR